MRDAAALVFAFSLGCVGQYQQVAIVQPANAKVVILAGAVTSSIETRTPFSGNFQAVSLHEWAAYRLTLQLDDRATARFGGNAPMTLYGRLVVGPQTEASKQQTLVLKMPDDKLTSLIEGKSTEIETFVSDPSVSPPKELARLTLRTAPF